MTQLTTLLQLLLYFWYNNSVEGYHLFLNGGCATEDNYPRPCSWIKRYYYIFSGLNFACPDLNENTGAAVSGRVGEKTTNNVKSWEDCSALCQMRSDCKYWTWHHANSGVYANTCATMTDAGGKFYNTDVVSGKRICTGGR